MRDCWKRRLRRGREPPCGVWTRDGRRYAHRLAMRQRFVSNGARSAGGGHHCGDGQEKKGAASPCSTNHASGEPPGQYLTSPNIDADGHERSITSVVRLFWSPVADRSHSRTTVSVENSLSLKSPCARARQASRPTSSKARSNEVPESQRACSGWSRFDAQPTERGTATRRGAHWVSDRPLPTFEKQPWPQGCLTPLLRVRVSNLRRAPGLPRRVSLVQHRSLLRDLRALGELA